METPNNILEQLNETINTATDEIRLFDKEMQASSKTMVEYDQEAGEVNLKEYITSLFEEHGLEDPEVWHMHTLDDDKELITRAFSYQRLIINRVLNVRISSYEDIDTRDQRYMLVNEGSIDDWKNLVKEVVAFMAKYEKGEIDIERFNNPNKAKQEELKEDTTEIAQELIDKCTEDSKE